MLFLIAILFSLTGSLKLPESFVAAAPVGSVSWGPQGYSAEGYGFRVEAQRMQKDRGRLGTGIAGSLYRFIGHPGTAPGDIYPGVQKIHGFRIFDEPGFAGQWTNVVARLDLWMLEWSWRRRLFNQGPARGVYISYGVGSGEWRETLRATYRYAEAERGSYERDISEKGNLEVYLGGLGITRPVSRRFQLDGFVRYQAMWRPGWLPIVSFVPSQPMHTVTLGCAVRYTFPAVVAGKSRE